MHSFMKRWEKEDNLDKTSYMYFIGHLIRAPFPQKIDKKKRNYMFMVVDTNNNKHSHLYCLLLCFYALFIITAVIKLNC